MSQSGNISGQTTGINVQTLGSGDINVATGSSAMIQGAAGYAIEAYSDGIGSIAVSTAVGDVFSSGSSGIVALNAATTIPAADDSTISVTDAGTIVSGSVLIPNGLSPAGVQAGYAPNGKSTTDPNTTGAVVINSYANITADAGWGIDAFNFGNGNVTVNVLAGTIYGEDYGIAVYGNGGTGNLTISASQDVAISTSNTTGLPSNGPSTNFGIFVYSFDVGNVSVTTSTGDTINSGSDGIAAINDTATIPANATSTVSVTAYGTVNSGSIPINNGAAPAGIAAGYDPEDFNADPNVTGAVTVNSYANINAVAGWGIDAFNFGNGNVTVNVLAGTVYGEDYGIAAYGSGGTGNLAISVAQDVAISTSNTTGLFGATIVPTLASSPPASMLETS